MPFFGRSVELAELSALVREPDPDARLVTVTGPGGIGKTRLVTELLRQLRESTPDRLAVFCGLDDVTDPVLAGDALASAAGARTKEDAIAGIGEAPESVLVLDGGDEILAAVEEIAEALLAASIDAMVIVTSRTRLAVRAERILELGPLDAVAAREMLSDAIHARGAAIPERDAPLLQELAAELEGIPLALELAAARAPVMGLRPLLHRLRSRAKDVLHGLETAIDGSWQAAEPHERTALAQATIFRGGFTIEAAEAILALPPKSPPTADVLEALLSRSLVRRTSEGRLALYAPIRDFAAPHLEPEEAASLRQRHVDWFASRAETAERAWLSAERENILSVIASVLAAGPVTPRRAEPALRLLVCALPVLVGVAPLDAFDALLDPVLEATKASGVDPTLLVRVMAARGVLRRHRGRAREGAEDLVRALAIVRASSPVNAKVEGELMRELGWALADAGRHADAREHFERALAIAQSLGDLPAQGRALAGEAAVLHKTLELAQAAALLERASVLHKGESSEDLHALGAVRVDQGRHAEARRSLSMANDLAMAQGDRRRSAAVQATLGLLLLDTGDLDGARRTLETAAAQLADLGAFHARAAVLGHLGIVAHAAGRAAEAWALLSEAAQRLGESDPSLSVILAANLALLDAEVGRPAQSRATLDALAQRTDRARMVVAAQVLDAARGQTSPAVDAVAKQSALLRAAQRCMQQPHTPPPPDDALVIAADGTWFRVPGGARVALDRRRPLARMLAAMARSPNRPFTSADLLASGWPSEKVIAEAGAHRVRVGIATLRKLGLRDAIKTTEDGYTLGPQSPLAVA